MRLTHSFLAIFAITSFCVAEATAQSATFLLPLLVETDGAHGDQYYSELAIRNTGTSAVHIEGIAQSCVNPSCPGPSEGFDLQPNATAISFINLGEPGRLFKVHGSGRIAAYLQLHYRRGETEWESLSVPVVPSAWLSSETIHFFNLRNGDRERGHLRVYSLEPTSVNVRAYNFLSQVVFERSLELEAADQYLPAFAEVREVFKTGSDRFDIEVLAENPAVPVWAMWSLSSNESPQTQIFAGATAAHCP